MNKMTIRRANTDDFDELTQIWLDASVIAHDFIPATYWYSHQQAMRDTYLPLAEVYLAEDDSQVYGFIALLEHKIAALFISPYLQGQGVGTALIHHAKSIRPDLELGVYQQNTRSVQFYKSVGFSVIQETIDEQTNSKEFVMRWEKSLGE